MFQATMSNSTLSEEATLSSFNPLLLQNTSNNDTTNINNNNLISPPPLKKVKKKRNLPGNPDPDAEVIALSPKSLLATNRFLCEICNKGFQRDQNLQLHRRGHNLPWKLKQRNKTEVVRKKAYVCPEPSCVHHHPSRALGDLTGIKKHFCRKHGEKKFKCEKCSKIYAVHSDWKAHSKTCGTREYRCDCGTLFSRKDSFITHRAFCDALAEESARLSTNPFSNPLLPPPQSQPHSAQPPPFPTLSTSQNPNNNPLFPFSSSSSPWDPSPQNPNNNPNLIHVKTELNQHHFSSPPPPSSFFQQPPHLFSKGMLTSPFTSDTNTITAHFLSATALLQKATTVGTSIQQSQQTQQAQAMLMNGFDELGASFRHVGPTTTNNNTDMPMSMAMSAMLPPQSPSSTTTTTTTTTNTNTTTNNHLHNITTMGMEMGMGMGMTAGSFATWKKNEDITRDFLGLTAGDQYSHSNGGGRNSDDDDMVGNMLKFTGGLQYGMTAHYDRDNSSPSSSSSVLLKPHHHNHHHQSLVHHDQQGSFGNFVTNEPPTATSDSRWG